jgi:hypothetical protein
MADSGIDWKNHSFLNGAIWGIYGRSCWDLYREDELECDSLTENSKWVLEYSTYPFTIPKELIDERYSIKACIWSVDTRDIRSKHKGKSDEEIHHQVRKHIDKEWLWDLNKWCFPFIVGLTKSDFDTVCKMKKDSPFWNVYKPTFYPPSRVITKIEFILERNNTTELDRTWVD